MVIIVRNIIYVIICYTLFGCNQISITTMKSEQKLDRQKIEAVLDNYTIYWNDNDMDSWGTLFTDDVDYINRKGGWWKNNTDNIDCHKHIHKMLKEMGQPKTFSLEIHKIEFLKPDVAVVQALSEWPEFKSYDSSDKTETLKGILTCVFVKYEGEWVIKTLHNTLRE